MTVMGTRLCENCRFWARDHASAGGHMGECREDTPKAHVLLIPNHGISGMQMTVQGITGFPQTASDKWCGRWQYIPLPN